ncbi:hypothetical protein MPH_08679 [Macrophomina phaseolina MS6]|uniref:Uncharacterized protein n=1 Tax=Macrophomina phaseolina (strain MS6) TaxID=1126212 RepID=K2RVE3_MACPH|nr:hypothetical protein MPH_08679 [Macrophomina phaseolina MS6]
MESQKPPNQCRASTMTSSRRYRGREVHFGLAQYQLTGSFRIRALMFLGRLGRPLRWEDENARLIEAEDGSSRPALLRVRYLSRYGAPLLDIYMYAELRGLFKESSRGSSQAPLQYIYMNSDLRVKGKHSNKINSVSVANHCTSWLRKDQRGLSGRSAWDGPPDGAAQQQRLGRNPPGVLPES